MSDPKMTPREALEVVNWDVGSSGLAPTPLQRAIAQTVLQQTIEQHEAASRLANDWIDSDYVQIQLLGAALKRALTRGAT